MNLTKTKKLYINCRNILDILESGQIHDYRYRLLISTMKVEQVEKIQQFVKECEDLGIREVVKIERELN